MFRRFASSSAIASMAIALAVLVVVLTPAQTQQRIYPLTVVWCFAPAAWGLWAMLAPRGWVPQRLPLWGAILGLIAGFLAAFVLNLPSRVTGETLPSTLRGLALVIIVVLYFFLWMLVRVAYRSLSAPRPAA
jgi:fructose-specific phosphotransferase system IIC component